MPFDKDEMKYYSNGVNAYINGLSKREALLGGNRFTLLGYESMEFLSRDKDLTKKLS